MDREKTDTDYYGEPAPDLPEEPEPEPMPDTEDMTEPMPEKTDADYYGEPAPDLPEKRGWVEKAKSYIPRVSHLGTSKGHGRTARAAKANPGRKARKSKVSSGPSLQGLSSGPSMAGLGRGSMAFGSWGTSKKGKGPSVNFSGAAFGSWGTSKKGKKGKGPSFGALTAKPHKLKRGHKPAKAAKPKKGPFDALGRGPNLGTWGKSRAKRLRF